MAQESTNLEKACDLLLLLSQEDEALPVAEISRRLDVSRTTAYAMLSSLASRGFVERGADGRFTTGFALLRVADGSTRLYPFLPKVEPYVLELAQRLGQGAMLAVYKAPCYLLRLISAAEPRHVPETSLSALMHPLQCAAGRLLMAQLPPEQLHADLQTGPSELLLPRLAYDPAEQEQKLAALRGAPYVIERGAFYPGLGSIAAPVYNRQGRVIAALSTPLFLTRLTPEDEDRVAADLTAAALHISSALGYPVAL